MRNLYNIILVAIFVFFVCKNFWIFLIYICVIIDQEGVRFLGDNGLELLSQFPSSFVAKLTLFKTSNFVILASVCCACYHTRHEGLSNYFL